MADPKPASSINVWRRRFFLAIGGWLTVTILMSFSPIRGMVAYPLYVHDAQAAGEAAYVMADGPAYWERLRAASDLYHWERVTRIIVLQENQTDGYNFVLQKSDSRFERTVAYLELFGVPSDSVSSVPVDTSTWLNSLSEARSVAKQFPDLKSIVVVTSAPHTRRSKLCFERTLPADVSVQVYSASEPQDSDEIRSPLWIEYAKLLVYLVGA